MDCEMREVVVRIDTGKVIRVLTNDLTSSAQDPQQYGLDWSQA
jgi:hypothetical protein